VLDGSARRFILAALALMDVLFARDPSMHKAADDWWASGSSRRSSKLKLIPFALLHLQWFAPLSIVPRLAV